jgi:hypothetical protein
MTENQPDDKQTGLVRIRTVGERKQDNPLVLEFQTRSHMAAMKRQAFPKFCVLWTYVLGA